MVSADVELRFEITPGRSPQAEHVVAAISAWVEMTKVAGAVIDPGLEIRIDLVGVEEGSQIFKFALRQLGQVSISEVKKYAMIGAGVVTTAAITTIVTNALTSDPQIPAEQMKVFAEMNQKMSESVDLQRQSMRFYGILQDEPAYNGIDVKKPGNPNPLFVVPRTEFAARSGVWMPEEPKMILAETRVATWDVVLIKPVLTPTARRWRFAREGLEFSALMEDQNVLDAIHNQTLPLKLAEGIAMKVEIHYREEYDGKNWLPVSGSHKVKRVLSPVLSSAEMPPLFSPILASYNDKDKN